MTQKYDYQGHIINVHDLPNTLSGRVISGNNGVRYWHRCAVEIVASEEGSDSQNLKLWAHVMFWKAQNISTTCYCYFSRNGTNYANFIFEARSGDAHPPLRDWSASGQPSISFVSSANSAYYPGIIRKDNTSLLAETYYPLGTLASGLTANTGSFYSLFYSDNWTASLAAATSYTTESVTLSYDANGGSGVIQSGTRIVGWDETGTPDEDKIFKLAVAQGTSFTWANHAFVGWATTAVPAYNTQVEALAHVEYNPGDYYTGGTATLYAVWYKLTSTITYDANSPSPAGVQPVAPASQTKQPTVAITLSSSVPDGSGLLPPFAFKEWNTNSDGSGTAYAPGATYSRDVNLNLYAIWTNNYTSKKSKWNYNPNVYRADKQGSTYVSDPYGEYLVVEGKVKVYDIADFNNYPVRVTITGIQTTRIVTSFTTDSTGTDNVGTFTIYSFEYKGLTQELDPGTAYNITLSFEDAYQDAYVIVTPTVYTTTVSVAFITFSTSGKGLSAAFGGEAASTVTGVDNVNNGPGRLDVNMNAYFNSAANFSGDVSFGGAVAGIPVDGTTIDYNVSGQLSYIGVPYTIITNGEQHVWSQANYAYTCKKYSDGTMEVQLSIQIAAGSGTSYNGSYFRSVNVGFPSVVDTVNNPPAFVDVPYALVQPRCSSNLLSYQLNALTSTGLGAYVFQTGTASFPAHSVDVLLFGHWQ